MFNANDARNLVAQAKQNELNNFKATLQKKRKRIQKQIKKAANAQDSYINFEVTHPSSITDAEILQAWKEIYEPLGYSIFLIPQNSNTAKIKIYWGVGE